jgi:dienelactone hydrolase
VKNTSTNAAARRKQLYSLLGDLPDRKRPIRSTLIKSEEREHYVLEFLVLDLNGFEQVPAFFVRPKNARPPFRTVLYSHAHGGGHQIGKRELIELRDAIQSPVYGEELAKKGYASFCIDHRNFGERHCRPESALFKETLWKGQTLWGLMIYDTLRALDYLCLRPDVDRSRIATLGLSMGSTMSWWTAALDERIKVCIDICCMTDFEDLIETRGLDEHGIYYYVPSLLKHFTSIDINALTVPRAHLSLNGNYDPLTPPRGLDRIDKALKKLYAAAGKPEAWKMYRANHGHFETAQMRSEVLKWLERWL